MKSGAEIDTWLAGWLARSRTKMARFHALKRPTWTPNAHAHSALNIRASCNDPWRPQFVAMLQPIPPRAETVVLPGVGTVVVFKEGSAFLAVRPDFEDIQVSPSGAGATPATAVDDLLEQERRARSLGYFVSH